MLLTDVPDSRFLTPLISDEDENDDTPEKPGVPTLWLTTPSSPNLESNLGGLTWANPVWCPPPTEPPDAA